MIYLASNTGRLYRWSNTGDVYLSVGGASSTDDIAEGTVNLFFTTARARAAAGLATPSVPGMVRVGSGLSVGVDGQLSVIGGAGSGGVPAFNELLMVPQANGQTVFTVSGGYSVGMIQVEVDGLSYFGNGEDYVANDGVKITLNEPVDTHQRVMLRRWTTSNNFPFSALIDKPTTCEGYGITDAVLWSEFVFDNLEGIPTTLAGHRIADAVALAGAQTITGLKSFNAGVATRGGLALTNATANGPTSTYQQSRCIQMNTDMTFGGSYNDHSGIIMYSIMPGGWTSAQLRVAVSTGAGTYATNAPALIIENAGLTSANNVTAYSDAKLKKDVSTVDKALALVNRMRGVFFVRKDDETGRRRVGVIAQEMQEVLPEVVMSHKPATEGEETILSVDYGNIVGVLIEAVKELAAEVEALKKGRA
ncbi:tail fiber domain-containing protein [Tardiphaga sp. 862_B3_N1_1]|uniref:tail fiber domain-containing protein n=1 Tax=Tardiphaga sp. 862_B3_N1_1 TaxID=3240763 RepID=UPI003F8B2CE4